MRTFVFCLAVLSSVPGVAQTLEQRLLAETPAALAEAARNAGDARRGAILFHQVHIGCVKCHAVDGSSNSLGPDLTKAGENKAGDAVADEQVVTSVLKPSDSVRKGFETVTVVTSDGKAHTGLLVERAVDAITIRDPARNGDQVTYRADEIDDVVNGQLSIMPSGIANQVGSRPQFLDLMRYVLEVKDGGLDVARQLQPPPGLVALTLPEYEERVDHAGLIRNLDSDAFKRGREIYSRLCINCHGDKQKPGSLPTALRFAVGKFKNGSDPYAMYRTLTHGYGLMVPQIWMVPQQKYDVIHFIRDSYLKKANPSQYVDVTDNYLESLPPGNTFGPEPREYAPWSDMNYGPSMVNTFEVGDDGHNFAYKGIATRLDRGPGGIAKGNRWAIFDHDTLRFAAAWVRDSDSSETGFINWAGIHFDGRHGRHPRIVGDLQFENPTGPGWAKPGTLNFEDHERVIGRDGRRYGPLPHEWAKYRGLHAVGDDSIVEYTVDDAHVLELATAFDASFEREMLPVFVRTLRVEQHRKQLTVSVATADGEQSDFESLDPQTAVLRSDETLLAGISGDVNGVRLLSVDNRLCVQFPASTEPRGIAIWIVRVNADTADDDLRSLTANIQDRVQIRDLAKVIQQTPLQRWPEKITTRPQLGDDTGPFAADLLTAPVGNPWFARLRFGGLDFMADGDRAVVCSWDGDVWLVSGLKSLDANVALTSRVPGPERPGVGQTPVSSGCSTPRSKLETDDIPERAPKSQPATPHHSESDGYILTRLDAPQLTWQRIAAGLFQPLGVKIVAGDIYVTCRDQLVILRDRNGDGETDFYECFNNDHQVTEHFHEFAMGLQRDDIGNFYYAKSARHALKAIVPHHGTLLRIPSDGSRTEILANGFRAANGVCLNEDGSFIVTDQEGHWNPKNRINWVHEGGFYGNMFGYHDVTDDSDDAMEQPLCWITNDFDRSPAELLWVDSDQWGPLNGSLLNMSYGYGKVYVVPHEKIDGQIQGGMCALPIPQFPTGLIRGRFHPDDGQLYLCGLFAWASSQQAQEGGFFRLRHTGKPSYLPVSLHARRDQIEISFTDPLRRDAADDPENFEIKVWSLKRTANYGSEHYNEHSLEVAQATLSADGGTVTLTVPDIVPTWCMEIRCRLTSPNGEAFERVIHNTIHNLGK